MQSPIRTRRWLLALALVFTSACLGAPSKSEPASDGSVDEVDAAALAPIKCENAGNCPDASGCQCGHCVVTDLACPVGSLRYALEDGTGACVPTPTQTSVGYAHACVRWSDGHASCWGLDCHGQLGDQPTDVECDPDQLIRPVPVPVTWTRDGAPMDDVRQITTGFLHTCVRRGDDTVWCWGNGEVGQLGGGEFTGVGLEPVQVRTEDQEILHATTITAGGFFTCALDQNGAAYCWGNNDFGQLGTSTFSGPSDRRPAAVPVTSDETFQKIAAGGAHTCATHETGLDESTYCWGRNNLGQIGHNDQAATVEPEEQKVLRDDNDLPLVPTAALGLGNYFSCAATGFPDRLWCWGENRHHALGDVPQPVGDDGTTAYTAREVAYEPNGGVDSLSAGDDFACVLLGTGVVVCWGGNDFGQVGSGSAVAFEAPTEILADVAALDLGFHSACAVTKEGEVLCWGEGAKGQLGNGSLANLPVPTAVEGLCAIVD